MTIALVVLFLSVILLRQKRKGKLPPGPRALPVLGNLHQLDTKDLVKSLKKLSNIYGPVFTIHLGPQPNVVLYGYKAVKEALVEQADSFSGRGDFPAVHRFTQGNGIAFSNGEKWKILRRFALVTLRNFGMGKRSVEERIQEEAQFLLEEFRNTNKKPIDVTFFFSRAVSNVICSIVFGKRFEYGDKKFLTLLELINDNFQIFSSGWGKEQGNPVSNFNMETLVMTTLNLFFGGTETVSTTLRYGILILMKYPDVTEKVHKEIDKVVGRNRCPTVEDRSKMPYTDAVIHEIQRFTSIIPLSLPHSVVCDTHFRGYMLPKGTNVIPVLTSVHGDPEKFKEPHTFNPENFLDEQNRFKNNDAFMPFSTGKRICLGEGLARMELFIFFTTLLQNLKFKPTVHPDLIDLTPKFSGVGNVPPTYQLTAVLR
ncbi:cytochrome P450 2G1-like isoform X2 [Pseudophryne corroboree]|uniref:cytochrome P450 2G1-like isoform X2 n=1 Tax=Pseudophryne corroboree TaxID=495146 RepID=UPI00308209C2